MENAPSVHFNIIPRILFRKSILGTILFPEKTKYNDIVQQRKEGCVLRELVEAVLKDLSSKDVFLFRVACASCAAEYGNKPIRFSKAEAPPATQSKQIIYDILYEQERKSARQTAIRKAAEQMNYCPICKRLVCNQCFLICEDLDMCRQCAAVLDQPGRPVLGGIVEA